MTPKQAAKGGYAVDTTTGRPGYIVHTEHGWAWISYDDGRQPIQGKRRPAQLERSTKR